MPDWGKLKTLAKMMGLQGGMTGALTVMARKPIKGITHSPEELFKIMTTGLKNKPSVLANLNPTVMEQLGGKFSSYNPGLRQANLLGRNQAVAAHEAGHAIAGDRFAGSLQNLLKRTNLLKKPPMSTAGQIGRATQEVIPSLEVLLGHQLAPAVGTAAGLIAKGVGKHPTVGKALTVAGYLPQLASEAAASREAFKFIRGAYGTKTALRSIPSLGTAFATYMMNPAMAAKSL